MATRYRNPHIDFDEAEDRANIDCEISKNFVDAIKMKMRREGRTKPTASEERQLYKQMRRYDIASDKANSLATKNDLRYSMQRRSEQTMEQYHFHKECASTFRLQRKKLKLLRKEKKAVKQIDKLLREEDKDDGDFDFTERIADYSTQCVSALGDNECMNGRRTKDYIYEHDLMQDEPVNLYPIPPTSLPGVSELSPPTSPISDSFLKSFTSCSLTSLCPPTQQPLLTHGLKKGKGSHS